LLLLVAASCDHKAATPPTSNYDRACTSGGECTPIFDGTITSCPRPCPNAAINNNEVASYEEDVAKQFGSCAPPPGNNCPPAVMTCKFGLCEFYLSSELYGDGGNALSITTAGYPKTCESVADCVSVYEGPLGCCGNPCNNAAISAKAKDHYEAELARRAPSCYPVPPCPGPPDPCTGRIDCQNGQCVLLGAQP
jgi:hypothetical protein